MRTSMSGPVAGAYVTESFMLRALALSTADQLIGAKTFESPARITMIRFRTLNLGTGTLTAHKVRRAAAGNAVVAVGGTQVLSADGGAIAANAQNAIEPTGTTPTLLSAQRNFAKGEQIGFFGSTDGGTANSVIVELTYYLTDHPIGRSADSAEFSND